MSRVAFSNQVVSRNATGQFAAACSEAARRTVEEAIEEGAQLSRELAPVGSKPDMRTIPLSQSIEHEMLARNRGRWFASARHALAQELGAAPHDISAYVRFFWEREGRWWMHPPEYDAKFGGGAADPIKHPGNAPQPYLRPAYEIISARLMQIARKHYPG